MKQIRFFIIPCQLILLICAACCASKPEFIGNNAAEDLISENPTEINYEVIYPGESSVPENVITEKAINFPFDPLEFVQGLHNDMEVVRVFPDPNIESWIVLPGKTVSGRQYFDYLSPLYSRPISSSDEMVAMLNHQTRINLQQNSGYIVNLDIDIRNTESKELEKKTLTLNIKNGTRFHDYRREGIIKYTLRNANGEFRYGAYVVTSAIIIQNNAEAEAYNALHEWMELEDRSEIYDLLEILFKK